MNKNKNKEKKSWDYKTKNKCILISFGTFLTACVLALFYAPLFISIIAIISFILGVVCYKKKTKDEKEAIKQAKAIKEALKYDENKNA